MMRLSDLFQILVVPAAVLLGSAARPCLAQEAEEASFSKVRAELASAVDTYNEAIESAEEALQSALKEEVGKISSSLSIDERVHQKTLLEGQVDAFRKQQTEPENKGLRKATEKFHKTVQEAAERCYEAHADAAVALDRQKHLEEAAAVLEERQKLFVSSPYWLPPIPPYVAENIEALLEHRPAFTSGFDKEFTTIVRAAKGKDRLRFTRAINAAIEAVQATRKAGEPAGNPNCRADIVLVLETIRAGEWDMRSLKIHYRDHRERKMHDGLPGVEYR